MEIRNRATGELTTVRQFKASNPNTSFPKVITEDIFASFGYDVVFEGPHATVVAPYEISVRDGVEEAEGQWFTKYSVGPNFVEYTDEDDVVHTVEEQLEQYKALIDVQTADAARSTRNIRLSECDWTQLADQPFSTEDQAAWAEYRQGLRDVPESAGFPHDFTWPEEPS
jgi:hypothetical protein